MFKKALILASMAMATAAQAEVGDISVGLGGSFPQGTGLEISYEATDKLNVRGVYYGGSLSQTETVDGIQYDMSLESKNPGLLLDFYPTEGRSFKLIAGAFANGNNLSASATPAANYTLGGTSYTAAEAGSLKTEVTFEDIAPYVGMGYDMHATERFTIGFEAGVIFQGSPKLSMTADGTLAADPAFQAELEAERAAAEAEMADFKYLPVAKITMAYRF